MARQALSRLGVAPHDAASVVHVRTSTSSKDFTELFTQCRFYTDICTASQLQAHNVVFKGILFSGCFSCEPTCLHAKPEARWAYCQRPAQRLEVQRAQGQGRQGLAGGRRLPIGF